MSADFRARQIRVNQIINSGSTSTSPLLVYGLGSAINTSGGFVTSHFITGSDTWLFVSGAVGTKNSSSRGVVTFKGDVVISGTIYNGAGAAYSTGGGGGGGTSNWNELSPSPRLNTTASVSIAGDLGPSYAAQDSGSDTFFFVSGTTGISGASARKSRFGGDVVIGGDLAINGGDVASSSPTVNLLNSATTLNVGNSSTTVNIGSGTVNIGLDNTSVNIDTKTNGFTLLESGAQYLKFSRSSGTAALIRSTEISYPSLYLSGQSVHLDAYSGATWFGSNADERLVIDLSDISNPSIRAKIPSGTPQNLIISGSKVTIGSNNGTTTFDRSGTGFLNVSYNGSTDVTVAANAGANISFGGTNASQLSGSFVTLNHGSGQINFQKDGLGFASFSSGSGISVLLTSALGKNFTIGGDSFTSLSGSAVLLNAGNAGFTFQKNGTPFSTISNESGNMLVAPNNQLILRPVSSNTQVTGSVSIKGSIIPDATNSYTLGTDSLRWAHVYTGDLHLRNERGDWTVIEENDFLRIVNNKTGKSYRMMMEPIDN